MTLIIICLMIIIISEKCIQKKNVVAYKFSQAFKFPDHSQKFSL